MKAFASALTILLLASHAFAQVSAADLETARALRREAKALRDTDPKAATAKFKAAHALAKTPVTGAELAEAYAQIGGLVEAREVALSVLLMPVEKGDTALSVNARKQAQELADALKTRIPSVRLTIVRSPADAKGALEVRIDGETVPEAALGEPRKVNPGTHEVAARIGSGETSRGTVSVKEGETGNLTLTVAAPVQLTAVPEPPKPKPGENRMPLDTPRSSGVAPLLLTGMIVGGVGLAVGAGFGLHALGKHSALKDACPTKTTCSPEFDFVEAERVGQRSATISTIGFVTMGIGGALVVSSFIWPSRPVSGLRSRDTERTVRLQPWVTPFGMGVNGAF
jgi:hypothetical protein